MSYAFCFGPSGSGKSRMLRQLIIQKAEASLASGGQDRTRYIVVVPEQYSMQTQRELVQEHPSHVLLNIDVLSFGRLAHRVFEETGADRRMVLDDIGKSLLLRRVASRCAKDLQILQRGIHRPGMIDEVKSVLSEFMQYGIGEEKIDRMADYAKEHGQIALQARLKDLRKLYTEFHIAESDSYVTSEETLDLLAKAIPNAESLRDSVIVFDGFTGFTTVQYRVVMALIRQAREVIFSFTVSRDQGPHISVTASGGPAGNEENLFYLSRKTVNDIFRMASDEGLGRGEDLYPVKEGGLLPRFSQSRVLAHLESSLFRYPEVSFSEKNAGETAQSLRLFAASSPQEEIRRIFGCIHRLIAETGCAYRDFAIVTADLETYGDLFLLEAERAGIPVYIDRTSGAFHNILVEGIRSVLEISAENFSYEAVFRYLRSGLSRLTPEETDRLENYCIANGVRGRTKWTTAFDASCEEARVKFLREVEPVTGLPARSVTGTGKPRRPRTAAVRTRELYDFLVGCGAQDRADSLSDSFAKAGDVVREKQYRQIYRTVIDLLDQIYDLAGQEMISARDYLELLEAGFTQIRLGTLPQRVDRILIGDIERTRLTQIRHLFIAGVNEGNIPRNTSGGGILSDMDREFLASGGVQLAPTPRQQMFIQRLYLYLNMTKPSQTLTVSFSNVSQDGKSLRPSYLISMLQRLFPALCVEYPELAPVRERITGRADGLRLLAEKLRMFVEGNVPVTEAEEFAKDFELLYGFYTSPEVLADPDMQKAVSGLRAAALSHYRPEVLLSSTARALYGKTIIGGISRMETGAKCFLRQHLRYGLRLRERERYEFAAADGGSLLHASLQRFDALLKAEGLSWRDFSGKDARRLSARALQEEAAVYRNLLLYKSARDENRLERYANSLLRTVDTLQYQIRKGDFIPAASELGFGEARGGMPAICFDLGNGRKLLLTGRIDRVDMYAEDGRRYLRIMDYKTGENDLNEDLIRRGLQLQLITYMEALINAGPERLKSLDSRPQEKPQEKPEEDSAENDSAEEIIPSAMLYYRMTDPVIKKKLSDLKAIQIRADEADSKTAENSNAEDAVSGMAEDPQTEKAGSEMAEDPQTDKAGSGMPGFPSADEADEEDTALLRSRLRPTGLVYDDEQSIFHLDRNLRGRSEVIPVTRKADGGYKASSHIIREEKYRELADMAREALCRLADHILDGDVTAAPAVLDARNTACDYCPYREACGFDPRIPGYSFQK